MEDFEDGEINQRIRRPGPGRRVRLGMICYINGGKSVYERVKRDPLIVGAGDAAVTTMAGIGRCYAAPVLCLGDEGFFRACIDNLP